MLKKLVSINATLIILFFLNFALTYVIHAKFIDFSFIVGLAATVIIWFFTSKGGFASRSVDLTVQRTTGLKVEHQKYEFSPTMPFITSLTYTIVSLIGMIIYYKNYF